MESNGRWGVLHFEQEEQTRSQFRGKERVDPVTGTFERKYPRWKRWATYAMTMPLMAGFTGGVLMLMFLVSARGRGGWEFFFWCLKILRRMYVVLVLDDENVCSRRRAYLMRDPSSCFWSRMLDLTYPNACLYVCVIPLGWSPTSSFGSMVMHATITLCFSAVVLLVMLWWRSVMCLKFPSY